MAYQVRAKTACDAVGLDRDRFNEEVAAGIYPCAPPTGAGRARLFEEPDLIGLYFYAYLRNKIGIPAKEAAEIACQVSSQARQLVSTGKPIEGDVVIVFDHAGNSSCDMANPKNLKLDRSANPFNIDAYSGAASDLSSLLVFSMTFALQDVLWIVEKRVKELTAPIGED